MPTKNFFSLGLFLSIIEHMLAMSGVCVGLFQPMDEFQDMKTFRRVVDNEMLYPKYLNEKKVLSCKLSSQSKEMSFSLHLSKFPVILNPE